MDGEIQSIKKTDSTQDDSISGLNTEIKTDEQKITTLESTATAHGTQISTLQGDVKKAQTTADKGIE